MKSLAWRLGVLLAAVVLAGCASPANTYNMALRAADATELRERTPDWAKLALAVKDVTGGRETNPAWMSQVGSDAFRTALEESLKSVGMHALPGKARYHLVAHLAAIDQPMFGASMTVGVTVAYQLIDVATRKTVLERTQTTSHTSAFNEAFSGAERVRLASEGAVRRNVTELVKHLQSLGASQVAPR